MNVTMIRHTAVDVPAGTCYGQTDVPLKDSFPQEAARVKSRLENIPFDRVYTSPLSRCTRLADYCGYTHAIRDRRLMEMDFGEWEMQRWEEISDPGLQRWFDDYFNVRATGGESFADQRDRLSSFLDELSHQPFQNVAVFAHGGILLQSMLLKEMIPAATAFDHLPPYGGIIEIEL